MKSDLDYQKNAPQVTFGFPPGCAWVCFSDQTSHAVMAGQYMMEHTLQLSPMHQYDKDASPLAILTRMQGHALVLSRWLPVRRLANRLLLGRDDVW